MSQPLIIDTDTASDDAVALIMALEHADCQVDAVTVVAGNVPLPQASKNARYTIEICQRQVPVYEGCDRPWRQKPAPADWFHGEDGMGNMHYPDPVHSAQGNHAVVELIDRFSKAPGQIDLITLGPLTNIATALAMRPELAGWVRHCYIMGGAACIEGNVTPAAEYNIWCDPEAAHKVIHSGMPITMVGWELSRGDANLDDADISQVRALGTQKAAVAMDCNMFALEAVRELQGEAGLALADPVAMAVALDPACAPERSNHFVDVVCSDDAARGMTVVDRLNVTGKAANVEVCWKLDANRFKKLLMNSLS